MKTKRRRLLITFTAPIVIALGAFAIGIMAPLEDYPLGSREERTLVIDDVSIVDTITGLVSDRQTIVITHGRIVYAGLALNAPATTAARRISGRGKYAIPGLWDMHVHTVALSPQLHFPLLLANGVTTVRNMGDGCSFSGKLGCEPDAVQWLSPAAAGKRMLPRFVGTASFHMEEASDSTLVKLVQRGDRMLKLQLEHDVDPALFNDMVRKGKKAGMIVAGHLPHSVDLLSPFTQSLDSIEHDTSLLPQCSGQTPVFDGRVRSKLPLLERADNKRCKAVLSSLATKGIGYVPTHVASSAQDWFLMTGVYENQATLRYTAWSQRALWRMYSALSAAGSGDEDRAPVEAWYRASLALTAQAHASGVAVMAGTDAIDAYVPHGFGLHDELAQLVSAGLTPLDALRAATLVPARHAGMQHDFGSIEAGKVGDLLLLNNNPLVDIANARLIDSVFTDGRLHDRNQLDSALTFVARQTSSFAVNCKFIWALIKS